MANEKMHIDSNVLIIGGVGVVGYFGVVQPLLQKFGILDSASKIANDAAAVGENAWKPAFWQKGPTNELLITEVAVNDFVRIIWNYPGVFADDYAAVLGVFKQLKTKSQVSYLSDRFQQAKKIDLYEYLRSGRDRFWFGQGLSENHVAEINKIVSSLPNYRP